MTLNKIRSQDNKFDIIIEKLNNLGSEVVNNSCQCNKPTLKRKASRLSKLPKYKKQKLEEKEAKEELFLKKEKGKEKD